ncbi:hypothetical protein ACSBR1_022477 [Camellia fascicularis]
MFTVLELWYWNLEIACGRKPINFKVPESQMILVEWVWDLYGSNRLIEVAVNPKICPNFVQEEIECLMIVGLCQVRPSRNIGSSKFSSSFVASSPSARALYT